MIRLNNFSIHYSKKIEIISFWNTPIINYTKIKMANFVSDFSLFPVKQLGNPKIKFQKATWPKEVDPEVHKMLNGERTVEITYSRKVIRTGNWQPNKIVLRNGKPLVVPDKSFHKSNTEYNYIIRKDSTKNMKLATEYKPVQPEPNSVPHDETCVVCMDEKKTHAAVPCGHLLVCTNCADQLLIHNNNDCPTCRTPVQQYMKIFF
jgi:hypothetical protein